jgi:hypothetical protein
VQQFEDVRRWAAVRAAGIARLLLHVEGHLVDVEGAVEDDDADLAAYCARSFVVEALSVASLCAGGQVERRIGDGNFDWFEHVDPELIERGFSLAVAPITAGADWDRGAWLAEIHALMDEIEALLDLEQPLPRLRSKEGMFPGLAAARDWMALCAELGVPVAAVATPN